MMFLNSGVTGHRGNCEAMPENAIAPGVDFLETDVRESADGVLFLRRDATTGRTCGTETDEPRKLNVSLRPKCLLRIKGENR